MLRKPVQKVKSSNIVIVKKDQVISLDSSLHDYSSQTMLSASANPETEEAVEDKDSHNSEKITKNKAILIEKELILSNPKTSRAADYKILPKATSKGNT